MLETKGLYKIYKPKKGVPVTALKNLTIRFPDRGMVFLLGKSGSGKSTLLNVLGGLDRYDQGEIIIKGVSSRDFKQKHFDSYRNTYVGFIFQEYNILEEFTVGANIALALQLQGKKATDEAINRILKEVDLEGFGGRRPNELSGGQKQRVAIARALVKNPEIIMADEPTGALDSATGRQVLETLKKLSKDRLVMVVSHDQEFAENYADRIIELADGEVLRDVERIRESADAQEEALEFGEETIEIRQGYQLTEEDRLAINEWLSKNAKSVKLHSRKSHGGAEFRPTDVEKIPHRSGANFKLIKSKLPLKNAFRIGGSSLKYKKFRLIMTILLSCVAFGLFGLSDTFGAYNHVETCTKSIVDTGIRYLSIRKQVQVGDDENAYWRDLYDALDNEDLEKFEKETGVRLTGVRSFDLNLNVEEHLGEKTNFDLYSGQFSGFSALKEEDLGVMGFSLTAGRLPTGAKNELAISRYMADGFITGGYRRDLTSATEKISSYDNFLGKILTVGGVDYTVVGIVDTQMDMERYQELAEEPEHMSTAEELVRYALEREFSYARDYSLALVAMVSEETYTALEFQAVPMKSFNTGSVWFYNDDTSFDPNRIAKLSSFKQEDILWVDEPRTVLAENEIILTADQFARMNEGELYNEQESLLNAVKNCPPLQGSLYHYLEEYAMELKDVRVVGVLNKVDERYSFGIIMANEFYDKMVIPGDYDIAVGGVPESYGELRNAVAYCYDGTSGIRYPVLNSVTYELDTVHEILLMMAKVFLYIGLGFAVFAALMLANFIAVSISYKKQEIGILRAIGSRSSDVFRIFFSESFIIAMINFVLSSIGVGVATALVNWILRRNGILISVLTFGPRQVVLLFLISLLVAALASYFPVRRIAAKRPIDAIRNR